MAAPRKPTRRSTRSRRTLARPLLGALVAASVPFVWLAGAAAFDPQAPAVVVVGSAGSGPGDRLSPERSGRAASALPATPSSLWRVDLDSGLEHPPVADAQGAIIAALVSSDVVKLAADGREVWRQKLGNANAVVAPVLASDGSVFVLASDNRLWLVSPQGSVRFALEISPTARKADTSPLARDDGSVVLATEDELVHVDGEGRVRARAAIAEHPSGGLIGWNGGTLVSTVGGQVFFWRAPEPPRAVGNFGTNLQGGAMLVDERTLVGVSDGVLYALDLRSGIVDALAGSGDVLRHFEGPPALGAGGELYVTTLGGELFALDRRGVPKRRLALEPGLGLFDADGGAAFFLRGDMRESPPLVVDPLGRIAFVRGSGRVAVIDERGDVHDATSRFCARPLGLVPAGTGRFAVVCRSGTIGMFGDGQG